MVESESTIGEANRGPVVLSSWLEQTQAQVNVFLHLAWPESLIGVIRRFERPQKTIAWTPTLSSHKSNIGAPSLQTGWFGTAWA